MSRTVKTNPFKQERDYWVESWKAAKKNPIPTNPELLGLIVEALLVRLGSFHRDTARESRNLIFQMAAGEKYQDLRADLFNKFPELHEHHKMGTMLQLGGLAINKVGKQTHSAINVKIQRILLKEYFDENRFPLEVNYLSIQTEWLKKHEKEIFILLGLLPCGCNYAESFEELTQDATTKTAKPKSKHEGEWLNRILATLHHTTPGNIKKTLNNARREERAIEEHWMKQYELKDFLNTATPAERQNYLAKLGFSYP